MNGAQLGLALRICCTCIIAFTIDPTCRTRNAGMILDPLVRTASLSSTARVTLRCVTTGTIEHARWTSLALMICHALISLTDHGIAACILAIWIISGLVACSG